MTAECMYRMFFSIKLIRFFYTFKIYKESNKKALNKQVFLCLQIILFSFHFELKSPKRKIFLENENLNNFVFTIKK